MSDLDGRLGHYNIIMIPLTVMILSGTVKILLMLIVIYGIINTHYHWSEYTLFNHNNDPFDSNDFIWNSKDINDGNSHLWNQKYSSPSTTVLGFVDCRVTSKMLGIGSAKRS